MRFSKPWREEEKGPSRSRAWTPALPVLEMKITGFGNVLSVCQAYWKPERESLWVCDGGNARVSAEQWWGEQYTVTARVGSPGQVTDVEFLPRVVGVTRGLKQCEWYREWPTQTAVITFPALSCLKLILLKRSVIPPYREFYLRLQIHVSSPVTMRNKTSLPSVS